MITAPLQRVEGLVVTGIACGVVAGVVFTAFQVLVTVLLGGGVFDYLRVIASIVLGPLALSASYPLTIAVMVGVLVRLTLASTFGVFFVLLLVLLRQQRASTGWLLVYGSAYGCVLWVVNFLGIAAVLFPQFTTVNQFWIGFVAHTFFYGTVLGLCVQRARTMVPSAFSQ